MQSKHRQDKSFHLKHRQNFKNPASQLHKKAHFQFKFINPEICLIGAMPTCSVVGLITIICYMWFNILCYDHVKRAPIDLRTHRPKSYMWLQVDYLSTCVCSQKQGLWKKCSWKAVPCSESHARMDQSQKLDLSVLSHLEGPSLLCVPATKCYPSAFSELKSISYNKVPDNVLEAQIPSGSPMSSQFFITYWDELGDFYTPTWKWTH